MGVSPPVLRDVSVEFKNQGADATPLRNTSEELTLKSMENLRPERLQFFGAGPLGGQHLTEDRHRFGIVDARVSGLVEFGD